MNLKVAGVLQCSCSYGFLLDYHYPRAHTTARRWRDPPPTCREPSLAAPCAMWMRATRMSLVGCRMCAEERPGADHGPRAGPGARRTPPTRAVVRRHARAAKRQMETRCAVRYRSVILPGVTLRHGRCGHVKSTSCASLMCARPPHAHGHAHLNFDTEVTVRSRPGVSLVVLG